MYSEIIKAVEPLISVTNYEDQAVQSLLTPNIMFINRIIEKNKKRYYRLIVWFDYHMLTKTFAFQKDLIFENLKFQLFVKHQNGLEKINENEYDLKQKLVLSFDEEQHRIINQEEDYLSYLIEEKYFENEQLSLTYNLNFSSANHHGFLNENLIGINRGLINLNLTTQKTPTIWEIPKIIVYLENDSWRKKQQVNYVLIKTKYQLDFGQLNYVNSSEQRIFKVDFETEKIIPLAVRNQYFLNEIIYDLENNFVSDEVIIADLKLASSEKLNDYYEQTKLDYQIKPVLNGIEVYLTSQWIFNPDLKKSVQTHQKQLVFNPLVKNKQFIELNYYLNNQYFQTSLMIGEKSNPKIVFQKRDLIYQEGNTFEFNLDQKLTYLKYLEVANENQKN